MHKMDMQCCECIKEHIFDLEMCPALHRESIMSYAGKLPCHFLQLALPMCWHLTVTDFLGSSQVQDSATSFLRTQNVPAAIYCLDVMMLIRTLQVESLLAMFVRCKDARQDLPVMPKTQRKIVHELAAAYGLTTQSYGQEPTRNLRVFRVSAGSYTLLLWTVMLLFFVMKHCQHYLS